MKLPFFREQERLDEGDVLSDALMEDTAQIVTTWQDTIYDTLPPTQSVMLFT